MWPTCDLTSQLMMYLPRSIKTCMLSLQLNFTELYDLDGCATFISDLMAYETLEDPRHPPEYLPSPMSTLGWQVGEVVRT